MKDQRFETFPQSTHNKFQKSCFVWTWRKRALKHFVFSIGILDGDKSCSGKSNRSSSAPIPISPHRTPGVGICGKSTFFLVYIRKNKLFFFSKNYNLRIYDCSYYLSFVLWLQIISSIFLLKKKKYWLNIKSYANSKIFCLQM